MSRLLLEQGLLSFHTVGILASSEMWLQASAWWAGWCWPAEWPQGDVYTGVQCFSWEMF